MNLLNAVPLDTPLMVLPLGVLGLVFGSFVTALSYRLPRGESIAHGRSRCLACGHTLTVADLVPVLSWVVQRGACRHCHARISPRYPAIEAATMSLFVAAGLLAKDTTHLVLLLLMTPPMMALAVIDLEHRRLPHSLMIALAIPALAWRWTGDQAMTAGLMTAAVVLVAGLLLDAGFRALSGGKPGLGMGDTKLFAVAGLALPLGPFLLFVTLAGGLGVLVGGLWRGLTRARQFPFAPAILAALWLCLVWGDSAMSWLVDVLSG